MKNGNIFEMDSMSQNKNANFQKYIKVFVTCFGFGLAPKAPGTFGSVFGLLFVLILSFFPWFVYFWTTIIYCVLGLWAVGIYLGGAQNADPKEVVIDEAIGILMAFLLVPISFFSLVIGFLLFRFFDILKPPPISFFDKKIPGTTGVMADDIVAGFIVNMIFHFLILPYGVLDKWNIF